MARPKYEIATLIRVEIAAPWKPGGASLVSRFLEWALAHDIVSSRGGGTSTGCDRGTQRYVGFYEPKHARRIRSWLERETRGRVMP